MKTRNLLVAAVIIIAMSFASCGGGGVSKSDSPSDVVNKMFSLLKAKKYDQMAELYVKDKGEKLTEEEGKKVEGIMAMASAEHAKKGGIKDLVIDEENIDPENNTAKVKYKLIMGDGSESSESIHLINVDGKWYMLMKLGN